MYVFIVGQEEVFGEDVVVEVLFCLLEAGGKNMASDFDLVLDDPRCIIRPKRAKCLSRSMIAC